MVGVCLCPSGNLLGDTATVSKSILRSSHCAERRVPSRTFLRDLVAWSQVNLCYKRSYFPFDFFQEWNWMQVTLPQSLFNWSFESQVSIDHRGDERFPETLLEFTEVNNNCLSWSTICLQYRVYFVKYACD